MNVVSLDNFGMVTPPTKKMVSPPATTTDEHIRGNDKADELAKLGAQIHADHSHELSAAVGRREITRLVQNMMVQIWLQHIALDDQKEAASGIEEDPDPWEDMISANDNIYNDDYEPFSFHEDHSDLRSPPTSTASTITDPANFVPCLPSPVLQQ